MPWRTINGNPVWIGPKSGISSSDVSDPRNPRKKTSSFEEEYNRERQKEFTKAIKEKFEKRREQSKAQKKQDKINKVFNLDLGHAKGFLIKATPVLVQLDPNLLAVYTSWKVGKYGYCFLKQVNEDYKTSDSFEESLKTVAKEEFEKKIVSKIKSIPLEKSSQYAANRIWTLCKETYSDGKIDPKWDKFAESALTKTIEEGWKLI